MTNKQRLSVGLAAMMLAAATTVCAAPSLSQPGQDIAGQLPRGSAEVSSEMPKAPEVAATFVVKSLDIDAAELRLNKEAIAGILAKCLEREVTFAEFSGYVEQVTRYCRQHGYPSAAAYLPVQEAVGGAVKIKVIPGRYGEIKIENNSRMSDDVIRGFLNGLKPGDIVRTPTLETALYGISDVSGTRAVALLSPGAEFGTSNLTVRVESSKSSSTIAYAENYGSKASGRYRYGLQESLYNIDGRGSKVNLGGLISNSRMHNWYANYEALVGRGGATLGLGVSRMDYQLGGMSQLGPTGTADTVSLFGTAPVYHESRRKLAVTYGFDMRRMRDEFKFLADLNRKKKSYVAHVGLKGYELGAGNSLSYDATLYTGHLSPDSDTLLGKRMDKDSETEGTFTKGEVNLTGQQSLGHQTELLLSLSAQMAGTNLDSSEQFYLGGANAVRAYPQGVASGDSGVQGTAELRYYTDVPGLTLSTFFDVGHVNARGTSQGPASSTTLKGWGLGIAYSRPNDWFARLDYARRIGFPDALSRDEDAKSKGRLWFIAGKIW